MNMLKKVHGVVWHLIREGENDQGPWQGLIKNWKSIKKRHTKQKRKIDSKTNNSPHKLNRKLKIEVQEP